MDAMSEYSFRFTNMGDEEYAGCHYLLSAPLITDPSYLIYERPFRSPERNSLEDNLMGAAFYYGWWWEVEYKTMQEYFYQPIAGDRWLLIALDPYYYLNPDYRSETHE